MQFTLTLSQKNTSNYQLHLLNEDESLELKMKILPVKSVVLDESNNVDRLIYSNRPGKSCISLSLSLSLSLNLGAPVAQWVKRWPTDLADRVRSPLEAKSSQP